MDTAGTFQVSLEELPATDGLARRTIDKTWSGGITATSRGEMLSVHAPDGSAAYVALENLDGTLDGRRGRFALMHQGTLRPGAPGVVSIRVVPGSGTDELARLEGTLLLEIADGVHAYRFTYTLDGTT